MKNILVIEDNPDVNENICEILELSGYRVKSAPNGKVGVELALSDLPDLILCDVMMPQLDGYGVLKILSKNEKSASIPFLFLTAKSEMKDLRKGMNLGAADYILKPFDDADLLESIALRLEKGEKKNVIRNGLSKTFLELENKVAELKVEWLEKFELRNYPAKLPIYDDQKSVQYVYFIVSGVVRSYSTNEFGKSITLDLHGANTFVGTHAALSGLSYSHNTVAVSDAEIILVPKKYFLDLFNTDIGFVHYLSFANSKIVEDRNTALVEMAYSSVRRRVALGLIKYGSVFHSSDLKNGVSIGLHREDLAELVGSAKETIIRTLGDFKSEGLFRM